MLRQKEEEKEDGGGAVVNDKCSSIFAEWNHWVYVSGAEEGAGILIRDSSEVDLPR